MMTFTSKEEACKWIVNADPAELTRTIRKVLSPPLYARLKAAACRAHCPMWQVVRDWALSDLEKLQRVVPINGNAK